MTDIANMISTVGYPIVSAVCLFFACKYLIDNNNKYIEKMFTMYDKATSENREAIEGCTKAIEKLCEKLDKEEK